MPGTNIKQVEAAERSALIKVSHYSIDLDLTTGAENFRVKTVIHFAGLKPGATTYIDCVGSKVISAKLNGADFDPKFDGETIYLPALAAENVLEIEHDGIYSNSGEGLHRFVDPADNEVYLYTQFETGDARRMYACFDQPDQKATFTPSHLSIGKLSLTTALNPPKSSMAIASSHNLPSHKLSPPMSPQSLPVHTHQSMMNIKARRQSHLASMPVNHSLSMSMQRTSLK